jgi:methionyl-tRNA formyltransferase
MNIAILTADEPLYLPRFFSQFLADRASSVRVIYTVPPRYGRDSSIQMARRYHATFGFMNLIRLASRTLVQKTLNALRIPGRGYHRSIVAAARRYGVRCDHVSNVNTPDFLNRLREDQIDLIISVSCPQVFKRPLIEFPRLGCLNVHGAILPKYRGIAPSFWMMAQGETEAGVTVFLVNEGIDAGDVIAMETFPILPAETLHQFIIRSKRIACEVLLRAIALVEAGDPPRRPLDTTGGSYFSFPTREAYGQFRSRGRRLW